MKTIALSLAAAFVLSGCVFVQHDRRGPGVVKLGLDGKKDRCRPNEYWDGNGCKHKGKGQGARKHDRD